jgi:hypothetical protein
MGSPEYMTNSRGHLRQVENGNPVCRISVLNAQGAGLTTPMRRTVHCVCFLILLSVIEIGFFGGSAKTEFGQSTGTDSCCAHAEFNATTEHFLQLPLLFSSEGQGIRFEWISASGRKKGYRKGTEVLPNLRKYGGPRGI